MVACVLGDCVGMLDGSSGKLGIEADDSSSKLGSGTDYSLVELGTPQRIAWACWG